MQQHSINGDMSGGGASARNGTDYTAPPTHPPPQEETSVKPGMEKALPLVLNVARDFYHPILEAKQPLHRTVKSVPLSNLQQKLPPKFPLTEKDINPQSMCAKITLAELTQMTGKERKEVLACCCVPRLEEIESNVKDSDEGGLPIAREDSAAKHLHNSSFGGSSGTPSFIGTGRTNPISDFVNTLLSVLLRAVQHLCGAHVANIVRDPKLSTHPRVSSASWANSNYRDNLSGRTIVMATESPTSKQNAAATALPDVAQSNQAAQQPGSPSVRHDEVSGEEMRNKTGCIGIRNQGSTCYLNSLVQTLFHVCRFRKAIYDIPADEEDFFSSKKTIPLAMQLLFYTLETSKKTVETTDLTNSFGWTARDTFIQHDIHEMSRILLDNLEEKLRKSDQPNVVHELFGGELENYIDVPEVDYRSSRKEPIYDLQLVVKNCGNIYDSFDKLFETEILDEGNKYCLERDGSKSYHRAERGIKILKPPRVLMLHLTRFDFDPMKGDMCKVLTRWDYYDVIDLEPYFGPPRDDEPTPAQVPAVVDATANSSSADKTDEGEQGAHSAPKAKHVDPTMSSEAQDEKKEDSEASKDEAEAADSNDMKYQLLSVLVHSGSDARFGHYYCYIRVGDQWLKFNDDIVSMASKYDTFGANFGGNTTNYWGAEVPKTANAYMLVYIRRKYAKEILAKTTPKDLPQLIEKLIAEQRMEEECQRQEQQEAHLYVKLWPMTNKDLDLEPQRLALPCQFSETASMVGQPEPPEEDPSEAEATGSSSASRRKTQKKKLLPIRKRRTDKLVSAARELELATGIPAERQVYWAYDSHGLSYRIRRPLSGDHTFHDACIRLDYRSSHECVLYVSDRDSPSEGVVRVIPTRESILSQASVRSGDSSAALGSNESTGSLSQPPPPPAPDKIITFHKWYSPEASTLVYIGSIEVGGSVAIHTSVLEAHVRKLIDTAAQCDGRFFVPPPKDASLCVVLERDEKNIEDSPTIPHNGEVFIWQPVLSAEERSNYEYPAVAQYKHFMAHRMCLDVRLNLPPNFARQFSLEIADDSSYEAVQKAIAKRLVEMLKENPKAFASAVASNRAPPTHGGEKAANGDDENNGAHPGAIDIEKKDSDSSAHEEEEQEHTTADETTGKAEHEPTAEDVDWQRILLAQHNPDSNAPYFLKPKKRDRPSLTRMLRSLHGAERYSDILYYEIADHSVEELEDSNPLNFEYFSEHMRPNDSVYTILFPQNDIFTVGEMLRRCAETVGLPDDHPDLRLVDIWKGKFFTIYDDSTKKVTEPFEQRSEYHIEYKPQPLPSVPLAEQALVHFAHFQRTSGTVSYHGDPFSLFIPKTDLVDDVMERVAAKLALPQQAVANWRPSVLVSKVAIELTPSQSVVQQLRQASKQRPAESPLNIYVGLEHAAMVGGRRGMRKHESALKIYH